MKDDYLKRKFREIEEEVAIAVAVANMIGIMQGKCTDQVITTRDECARKIIAIVERILKKK